MLYEMITGRPPFLAATELDTLMRLLNEEPVPPSRLQPRVSRDLETICIKCLQKNTRRRYSSAAELTDDLKRFQAGETILARPVGRLERAWRWGRRNPRVAALSGTVAILLVAVAVTLSVMGLRMAREREAMSETRKQAHERLELAIDAMETGDVRRALDFLQWSDPLLTSTASLDDIRARLDQLRTQATAYAEFRSLLDNARYLGLYGSKGALPQAQAHCHDLLALYDSLEKREGKGREGWPPLDDRQKEVLKEDIFAAFLISAQVERLAALAANDDSDLERATRQAVDWLNRAELLLPPTKALFVFRGAYFENLGDMKSAEADLQQAAKIQPTCAVDRFWHAYADSRRADKARQDGDAKSVADFLRKAITGFASVVEMRPENSWANFAWAE
jgi:tetratricopeptide (TPR) repeat protein